MRRLSCVCTDVIQPFGGVHLLVAQVLLRRHQTSRVNRVERGVGPVSGAGQLAQFTPEIGFGELLPLLLRAEERISVHFIGPDS